MEFVGLSAFGESRVGLGSTRSDILAIPGAHPNDVMRDEAGFPADGAATFFHVAFDEAGRARYVGIALRELASSELQAVIKDARRLVGAPEPPAAQPLLERERRRWVGESLVAEVSYDRGLSSPTLFRALVSIERIDAGAGT